MPKYHEFFGMTQGLSSDAMAKSNDKKAICIVSGGLDSICAGAYVSRIKKYNIYMINFSYGQRAKMELSIARDFAIALKAKRYHSVDISFMKNFYGQTNALTDDAIKMPLRFQHNIVVPIRNAIFITIATAWALSIKAQIVCYGAHTGDNHYPDCRPSFVRSITRTLTLADLDSIKAKSRNKVKIWCPASSGIDKSSLLKIGYRLLGNEIFKTWSCYSNGVDRKNATNSVECGICESCVNRKNAFRKAGIEDLTGYDR